MSGKADGDLVGLTRDIVVAFVGNQAVDISDVPGLVATIYASLAGIDLPQPALAPLPPVPPVPAVPIRTSITDDFLICLEDGKRFKSMKRHLQRFFGMTPDQYRTKWDLPRDYPMVAPDYAAKRSRLAKASGLGIDRRKAPGAVSAPGAKVSPTAAAPRKRGRPRIRREDLAA